MPKICLRFVLLFSILCVFANACHSPSSLKVSDLKWTFAGDVCQVSFVIRNPKEEKLYGKIRVSAFKEKAIKSARPVDLVAEQFLERDFEHGISGPIQLQIQTLGNLRCDFVEVTIAETSK